MQARRLPVAPPLAIVVPQSLPRRRSSQLSSSSSSPHTPRSRGSPTCSSFFLASGKRKSTDSWGSSNQDGGDDLEHEWIPDQTLLLTRTLDALPDHLLTPFNGAVPPSNLLDKIARGVSQAKGSEDWPHSVRATRVKLVELARTRAKDSAQTTRRKAIPEEDDFDGYFDVGDDVLKATTNTPPKRSLYRQSSIDFLISDKLDLKNNDNINRLSNRLQRTERLIPNPNYHPYSRQSQRSRSPSPSHPSSYPPSRSLNTSTPSSTTLNSTSVSSTSTRLRRTVSSTLSESSDASLLRDSQMTNSRVQCVRRSESYCGLPMKRQGFKRAPSFGTTSIASAASRSSSPSSDEEEKVRSKKSKKPKLKTFSPTSTDTESSDPSTVASKSRKSDSSRSSGKTITSVTAVPNKSTAKRPRANVQRNPSILGAELPNAQQPMRPPQVPIQQPNPPAAQSNPNHPIRPLRRMRATSFARAPARRISFSSMDPQPEELGMDTANFGDILGGTLGSAFQLQ